MDVDFCQYLELRSVVPLLCIRTLGSTTFMKYVPKCILHIAFYEM